MSTDLERARSIAVALEQELADLTVKHAALHEQFKAAVTTSVRLALDLADMRSQRAAQGGNPVEPAQP